ncbi:MAG: hypothetical protein J5472_05975 [Clostridia bacterium]|nr:hypothetical protein [Clostridia bacterium]
MTNIIELLKKNGGISAWRVSETATKSYELFFVHRQLETVRATDTLDTKVTVYVDHDGCRGDSTFTVSAALSDEEAEKKIADAVGRAGLVSNPPYTLPEGETLRAELPTNMQDEDPKALGRKIADAVFAADSVPGGSINACEIFLYRDTLHVRNSSGVDKSQVTHRVMIEAIPTFTDDKQSVELYEDYRFTVFDPEKITAEIARKMAEVRDRVIAEKPQTPLKTRVLLRPHEIRGICEELSWALSYNAVYSHATPFSLKDDLQEGGDGDRLTLTMRGVVEGSEDSAFFDEDGTALTDTCVIDKGVVKNNHGSSRYGQYLNVERPSGNMNCMVLDAGTVSDADLKSAPYLECVSLSGLQMDLFSDYIGGEIRLAYWFDGRETRPVTGITMSGKLSDVLKHLRLSRETVVDGAYQGPALLLMPEMTVL